ncbi:MAG TPA: M23 family metallopeptidase [Candidatus Limnocylindria bacterium]|nr:M23 family metallopeptidase [Candidatus Limnocylindria bacterium]
MPTRAILLLGLSVIALSLSAMVITGRYLAPPDTTPVVAPQSVQATPAPAGHTVRPVTLRRGDTLVSALRREGLDRRVSHEIAYALVEGGADLRRMRPRHGIEIAWSLTGEPVAVRYEPSPWIGYAVIATDDGWKVKRSETRPDIRVETVRGEVTRSLFEAVEQVNESPQLVLGMVEIFSSDFDFTADTRAGDRFRLLVEKRYAADQFVDYGRLLVAQYVSDGRMLTGVGFEQGSRYTYYDADGRSLKKSFLKSPLEFTRITSGFTYARPHPILGGTRPHLAIDYGAPVGTPVRAVADGTVARSGWNGGNGISVTLRHRSGYGTMYNHLSRLGKDVRPGARVTQRQVIGYVGSTGLSTGPHLDYRVSKNGRFVNPLSEKFVPGEPIPATERAEFLQHARTVLRQLEATAPF